MLYCNYKPMLFQTEIKQYNCFCTGKPVKLKNDPDNVPSGFVYSNKTASSSNKSVSRCKRLMQRREHRYSASLQTRHNRTTTTPFATVTENYHSLPEQEMKRIAILKELQWIER